MNTIRTLAVCLAALILAGLTMTGCRNGAAHTTGNYADSPSHREMTSAVHDILTQAALESVAQLGQEGGFSENPALRIGLPEQLVPLAGVLETLGQGGMVADLEQGMNRAAEEALPAATGVLLQAITDMHVEDVHDVVTGPPNAATMFLERTTRVQLMDLLTPLVAESTQNVGVMGLYSTMLNTARMLSPVDPGPVDLDAYIASKALDGLFTVMAGQEELIRTDPATAATSAARKVFSYYTH